MRPICELLRSSQALSLFVLRASPVFLGEMNGTATSLVRPFDSFRGCLEASV